jgi:hypothetical protein
MSVEDFVYEKITEGDFEFDFYVVYSQTECDDPYYPPYQTNIGNYKSKENAIKSARERFYKMAEEYTSAEDRKYGGVDNLYYIKGNYFEDSETEVGEDGEKKKRMRCNERLYVIYDKEEQAKVNARWEMMHKKIG